MSINKDQTHSIYAQKEGLEGHAHAQATLTFNRKEGKNYIEVMVEHLYECSTKRKKAAQHHTKR